jgi:transcriptional regulator with XRE-family HTH domain
VTAIQAIGPQVCIRQIREAHGLTLEQLADRIEEQGYARRPSPDHLSNVECGNKAPSTALMTAWCKALGLNALDVYVPAVSRRSVA